MDHKIPCTNVTGYRIGRCPHYSPLQGVQPSKLVFFLMFCSSFPFAVLENKSPVFYQGELFSRKESPLTPLFTINYIFCDLIYYLEQELASPSPPNPNNESSFISQCFGNSCIILSAVFEDSGCLAANDLVCLCYS